MLLRLITRIENAFGMIHVGYKNWFCSNINILLCRLKELQHYVNFTLQECYITFHCVAKMKYPNYFHLILLVLLTFKSRWPHGLIVLLSAMLVFLDLQSVINVVFYLQRVKQDHTNECMNSTKFNSSTPRNECCLYQFWYVYV